MGKSAKAAKRPSKKQSELKKIANTHTSTAVHGDRKLRTQNKASPTARASGGGVSKPRTTKAKAKLVAAKGNRDPSGRNVIKKDYLQLFSKR
ncbi:hypothetical protein H4217_009170 [Coemansia sp. RSA 1939]|nr:hypothetical protein H4217_009170 [Coemansia sp. RSA 1939]